MEKLIKALKGIPPRSDDTFLVAVEFGYKQCEKGVNLQTALRNAKKLFNH